MAYGVAINKLTLPIPTTSPSDFRCLLERELNLFHVDVYLELNFSVLFSCQFKLKYAEY